MSEIKDLARIARCRIAESVRGHPLLRSARAVELLAKSSVASKQQTVKPLI